MRKALKVTVENKYEVLDLDAPAGSLKVLQDAVGGLIQPAVFVPGYELYVNEEGIILDLPINPWLALMTGFPLRGDGVITGDVDDEGETLGLTDEQIKALTNYLM